ncbi:hypothetical protein VNO78_23965 [Psophocarpus tetragonolobus]|uniref:Uncharacterized protein n=1 Tax=Psophocarpus tetragonolobus TaxID=3891 RepID=A0AAN9S7P5_PSOTE
MMVMKLQVPSFVELGSPSLQGYNPLVPSATFTTTTPSLVASYSSLSHEEDIEVHAAESGESEGKGLGGGCGSGKRTVQDPVEECGTV